jgi:hypothetical protein
MNLWRLLSLPSVFVCDYLYCTTGTFPVYQTTGSLAKFEAPNPTYTKIPSQV